MVHDRKAAAPSSAQVLCGAAQAENNGPNNVQRAVEVHSHSLGKELVVFAGSVSQDELLGVTWGRQTQKEWQEWWIRSCAASVCSLFWRAVSVHWSVPSHQGPILHGTGWVPRREPHPKPATAPGKGMFELWAFEVAYEEKREKKTYTKNQPRAVLSSFPFWKHLPFLMLNLPVHFRSMFKCTTLWTCDLVTKSICVTEEVAQRLVRARAAAPRVEGLDQPQKSSWTGCRVSWQGAQPEPHLCFTRGLNIHFWHI